MKVITTKISDLLILIPDLFEDNRGSFFESYNKERLHKLGIRQDFVQDNESRSKKGVIRGLPNQLPPYEQAKLVRVIKGAVLDVAVDLRKDSATFGQWFSVELNDQNKKMMWIPAGFAHGFVALEDDTVFVYKCTKHYNSESERSIRWNDPDLNIDWGIQDAILSEKDKNAPLFREIHSPF